VVVEVRAPSAAVQCARLPARTAARAALPLRLAFGLPEGLPALCRHWTDSKPIRFTLSTGKSPCRRAHVAMRDAAINRDEPLLAAARAGRRRGVSVRDSTPGCVFHGS